MHCLCKFKKFKKIINNDQSLDDVALVNKRLFRLSGQKKKEGKMRRKKKEKRMRQRKKNEKKEEGKREMRRVEYNMILFWGDI